MKLSNINYLAKVNSKGTKSKAAAVLMFVLVLSLTLISVYSATLTNSVDIYKRDYRARTIDLFPWFRPLTDEAIAQIENLDHVESVCMLKGMGEELFSITGITNRDGSTYDELQSKIDSDSSEAMESIYSLVGDEERTIIAGESLDDSPTFSCIIPSLFYPFDDTDADMTDVDYLDSESLIGKTITVKAYGDEFMTLYNYVNEGESYGVNYGGNEWIYLPALEFKLKIVGVYYSYPTGLSSSGDIVVSEETGREIMEQELAAGGVDLTDSNSQVAKWWNNNSLRTHYVVVDDVDNIDDVYNEITEMGYCIADEGDVGIKGGTIEMSNILSISDIVIPLAVLMVSAILIIQSSANTLIRRKGELGLMKAMGYKNGQIFASMCLEELRLTVPAMLAGGAVSAAVIFILNLCFGRSYYTRLYIADWSYYFIFLALSVAAAVIIPLLCKLIFIRKLRKISPKEAMSQ